MAESVTIVETPRDAFQGLPRLIPTEQKIQYVQALLDAGYKHIDLGSFVSPKVMPQMADSGKVIAAFRNRNDIERIAIVVNEQGMEQAVATGGLDALGFPFSLSRTFQLRNTRRSTAETFPVVEKILVGTEQNDLSFILYLSMAFGNPYGEPWDEEALFDFIASLRRMGVRHISLADTVAAATPEQVQRIFERAKREHPPIEFSAHFHGRPDTWFACVQAALDAGCRRFDAATGGLGGCPFAQDALVANIPADKLAIKLGELGYTTHIDLAKARASAKLAAELQKTYATA